MQMMSYRVRISILCDNTLISKKYSNINQCWIVNYNYNYN